MEESEFESSARSLNFQSWSSGEERKRGSTPLLGRGRSKNSASRRSGSTSSASEVEEECDVASDTYSVLRNSYDKKPALFVRKSVFGEVRNCQRFSCIEWVFVIVATISMIGIGAMSVERFIFIHSTFLNMTEDDNDSLAGSGHSYDSGDDGQLYCNHWSCLNDFIFAVVVLVNWLFCIYYSYDGLLRERPFEMFGYAITIFIIFSNVVINYFVEGEQKDVVKLIRLVLVVILGPLNMLLAVVVQNNMGYLILHTVGCNKKLTRAYHIRSLYLTVQIFNIQILTNILVLSWVKSGHFTHLGEKIFLPLLIVYMIIISYLGWFAVLWEIKPLAVMWNFLAVLSLGYYIYKIVNIGTYWSYYKEVYTNYFTNDQPSSHTHFLYIAIIILFSCIMGSFTCLLLYFLLIMALLHFGLGLREAAPPPCDTSYKESNTEH